MGHKKKYLTSLQLQQEVRQYQLKENQESNYIDWEKLEKEKLERQKNRLDMKPDSLAAGWLIYIIIMVGGLIFNDYIILAVATTIIFFSWRHHQIEIENGREYRD